MGVTTSTTLEQQASVPFPGVTVCNQNRVHCGNLYDLITTCEAAASGHCSRRDAYCQVYRIGGCEVSMKVAHHFLYGNEVPKVCVGFAFNLTYEK